MAKSRPSDIFKDLEDMLECGLCLEICNDPRTLTCHHWYCTSCIQQLIDTSDCPSKFNCPSCRTEIPQPAKGATHFPAAFFVNKIDEVIRIRKEAPPEKQDTCSRHKKPLDAYCATCKQTLCITCILAHDGHKKLMISEMQQQMEKPVKETIQVMQQQVQECEAGLIEMSKAKHNSMSIGEVQKRNLRDHGKKLMNTLQQTIDKMEQQIDDHISATIHKYESNENNLKTEISKRAEAIVQMEAFLKDKDSSDILDLEPYKALIQNRELCKPIPEMKINLKLSDLSKLTDELLVGTVTCLTETAVPQAVAMASKVSFLLFCVQSYVWFLR
eukprot:GHVT01095998.1.p1 GENE.GHVT01095998.1~~GHVT01095998.1.p1  ORF type:complete len:329 (-),score=11.72 GHVT01095998.1:648-1634(-)